MHFLQCKAPLPAVHPAFLFCASDMLCIFRLRAAAPPLCLVESQVLPSLFLQCDFFWIGGRRSERNRKLTFDLNIGGRRSSRNFCSRARPVARGAGCEPCKTSEISSAASSFDSHSALASLRGGGSNGPPPRMLSNSLPPGMVGDAGVCWRSGRFPRRIDCLGTTAADACMANFTSAVVVSPAKAPVLHKASACHSALAGLIGGGSSNTCSTPAPWAIIIAARCDVAGCAPG